MAKILISEAFFEYEQSEIIAGGLSKKTLESYVYAEKLAEKYFNNVDITTINAQDVREFYAHLLTWQKPDTARGNILCFRAVIGYLNKSGVKTSVDQEHIKVPKREKREIQYLTEPEVEEFINVVGQKVRGYSEANRLRNIAICKLLYTTGIRVGELCALNRNSIRDRQFTVIGKSKSPRVCFITSDTEKAIGEYLEIREDNNSALFVASQTGRRITPGGVRIVFKNACDRSDFSGIHPHTLRHSFATKLLDKEVDLRYIADLMGHESLDTTRLYTHFTNPKLRRIYEQAMA